MNPITTTASTASIAANQAMEDAQQYLSFMLSGKIYAISISRIKEIIQYGQVTEVPRMPDFIRGVINLRGAVVPVIDLNVRFGKPITTVGRRNCIIIIEVSIEDETQNIGVMVDAVNAVLEIPASQIEKAPTFGTNIHAEFIDGMAKVDDKFLIILNIQRVLSMDDMVALAEVSGIANPELPSIG